MMEDWLDIHRPVDMGSQLYTIIPFCHSWTSSRILTFVTNHPRSDLCNWNEKALMYHQRACNSFLPPSSIHHTLCGSCTKVEALTELFTFVATKRPSRYCECGIGIVTLQGIKYEKCVIYFCNFAVVTLCISLFVKFLCDLYLVLSHQCFKLNFKIKKNGLYMSILIYFCAPFIFVM